MVGSELPKQPRTMRMRGYSHSDSFSVSHAHHAVSFSLGNSKNISLNQIYKKTCSSNVPLFKNFNIWQSPHAGRRYLALLLFILGGFGDVVRFSVITNVLLAWNLQNVNVIIMKVIEQSTEKAYYSIRFGIIIAGQFCFLVQSFRPLRQLQLLHVLDIVLFLQLSY